MKNTIKKRSIPKVLEYIFYILILLLIPAQIQSEGFSIERTGLMVFYVIMMILIFRYIQLIATDLDYTNKIKDNDRPNKP